MNMKRKNRIFAAAAVCSAVSMLFCGCTKKYEKNDIVEFIRNKTGISDFKVNRNREEITDTEDGYTDYLWTAVERDGTEFHVLDDYHWGMEALVNTLWTDYYDVHLIKAFPDLPHSKIELESSVEHGFYSAGLKGTFSSRSELLDEIEELRAIQQSDICPEAAGYSLLFNYPYRVIGDYDSTVGDSFGNLRDTIDTAEAETKMLLTCVDQQLPCRFEFTEDEIHNAVEGNSHQLGIRNGAGSYTWYDDLCADQFSYGVSFASMYELLLRNGYDVEGTPQHFSVTAPDGTEYEFSYDFVHPSTEHRAWMYYLKNGEITDMNGYFYTHFNTGMIYQMFGLDVLEYWNVHQ